ncbi:liprin-alpha-1-like [Budorcas taxicolor]|uniref:liprin-alpha-1-like n=1 Tax=Budorcas taxicolor TaxID=37181 RepID=UPI002283B0A5|nr:liprin-alpha-1-like [Budorcas taxicolor]
MKECLAARSAHVTELEEDLDTARKDLLKSEDVNVKLQRDIKCCPALPVGTGWAWSVRPGLCWRGSREHCPELSEPLRHHRLAGGRRCRLRKVERVPRASRTCRCLLPALARHRQSKEGAQWPRAEDRQGSIEERLRQMEAQLEENKELQQGQLILTLETLRAELDQTRLRGAPFHHGQPHLGSTLDLRFPVVDQPADSSGNGAVLQHPQKGWLAALCDEPSKVQTEKEQDWERAQQASVLADVAQAFQSDEGVSDGEGDRVTLFSSATQLSPIGQADAKTLSMRLQEQLDTINEEIRLMEEEKENTEQWAEETESREGRGSLGSLRRYKSVSSLNLLAGSSGAGSYLPLPKPRRRGRRPAQEGDQLGIMTVLPALREEVGDDETAIKSKTSTPTTPRSLRLDRLHTGSLRTANQEDIRDAHNSTGSEDSPENNPSSSSSSRQDSLHKAPKKKGIKSSIRRWIHRKEKGRPEHPGKEALSPEGPVSPWRDSWNQNENRGHGQQYPPTRPGGRGVIHRASCVPRAARRCGRDTHVRGHEGASAVLSPIQRQRGARVTFSAAEGSLGRPPETR